MKKFGSLLLIIGLCILLMSQWAMAKPPPLHLESQDGNYRLFFNLQYRPRFEFNDNLEFAKDTENSYISHRARLSLTAQYQDEAEVVIQVQDVRLWGEESLNVTPPDNTLFDYTSDGFDLHQGYLLIKHNNKCFLKLGRQEIALDGLRLIGNVNWSQQGRSFDAVRAAYKADNFGVDLMYAKLLEGDHKVNGAEIGSDRELAILHGHFKPVDGVYTSLIAVWDGLEDKNSRRWTIGPYVKIKKGGFHSIAEGYGQFGRMEDNDYRAYMASGRAGYTIDIDWKPTFDLWFDYLSGDDKPNDDKTETFDTLYATNHIFYGLMDYFLNIPLHTGGLGIMDMGAMIKIVPDKRLICKLDVHHFLTSQDTTNGHNDLGTEIDLTVKMPWIPHVTFITGISVFCQGNAMEDLKGTDSQKTETFGYVMADVSF